MSGVSGDHDKVAEQPRAVFLAACEKLASRATSAGFEAKRKSQELARSRGPWQHKISLASSGFNRVGAFVALTATVSVWNKDLERWRHSTGGRTDGFVASRMLHRFADGSAPSTWDLSDPAGRDDVIDDVMSIVDGRAVGWLDLFDDRLTILARWDFDEEVLELDAMAELLLFLGRRDEATAIVRDAIVREPWSRYSAEANSFRNLRKLDALFTLDLPIPTASDPKVESAAIERLRQATDERARRP